MAELLKRIIEARVPNVFINDLKVKLRNVGDSIDLLTFQKPDGTRYGLEDLAASRDLDSSIASGHVYLYNEDGTLLTGTNAQQATNLSTLYDAGSGGGGDVPSSRTIATTSPLLGGGDLSANRTISLAGLSGLGSGNQILGMNFGGTAYFDRS